MLAEIKANPSGKLYIKTYIRLGRGIAFFNLRSRITEAGLNREDIFFYTEPNMNRRNYEDDSIIMIKVGANLITIENARKEYQKVFKSKIGENKPFIPAPYGYRYNSEKGSKMWVIEGYKTSHVVRSVLRDYADGVPMKKTIADLRINGSLYYRILHNWKLYFGWIVFYKSKDHYGVVLKVKERVEYKGEHQAIVNDDKLFKKFEGLLSSKKI